MQLGAPHQAPGDASPEEKAPPRGRGKSDRIAADTNFAQISLRRGSTLVIGFKASIANGAMPKVVSRVWWKLEGGVIS
jgi:hypothetical protein